MRYLVTLFCTFFFPLFARESLSQPTTAFTFSLYKALGTEDNAVFSPFSIYTCLAMPYMGSKGNTEATLEHLLKLPPSEIASTLSSYVMAISSPAQNDKSYQLNIANSLWMSRDILILASYRKTIEEDFRAAVQTVDFRQPQVATDKINLWISDHTQQKIPHLLSSSDISSNTKIILANAIYFRGAWMKPFNPERTTISPFWRNDETCFDVPTMEQTAHFLYHETDDLQLVSLPIVGREHSDTEIGFLILLPKRGKELSHLTPEVFTEYLDHLGPRKLHLKIPKFTLDERIDLNRALSSMGIAEAFTANADFSGIDGRPDLFFSKAIHQAYLSIDEVGLTAAAATAIGMMTTSIQPSPLPLIEFIADHPFLFFIVDLKSRIPLFMGKLSLPPCS